MSEPRQCAALFVLHRSEEFGALVDGHRVSAANTHPAASFNFPPAALNQFQKRLPRLRRNRLVVWHDDQRRWGCLAHSRERRRSMLAEFDWLRRRSLGRLRDELVLGSKAAPNPMQCQHHDGDANAPDTQLWHIPVAGQEAHALKPGCTCKPVIDSKCQRAKNNRESVCR